MTLTPEEMNFIACADPRRVMPFVESLIASRTAAAREILYDLIVDHPMWIDDDGQPLEYHPEREGRIGDFLEKAIELLSEGTTDVG